MKLKQLFLLLQFEVLTYSNQFRSLAAYDQHCATLVATQMPAGRKGLTLYILGSLHGT